ncbi:MAG: hypothetical protein ACHQAZ_09085 [Gammaproteobacteria bacterium]|jgi:hypothetical protein|nr:hypothetical protein [Gammaproteobacteria bacterium]
MNTAHKLILGSLAAASLLFMAGAGADVRINSVNGDNIALRGDDVVITAEDDSEALITPAGDLLIHEKRVALTGEERGLLRQYAAGVHDIQQRGLEIGQHAVDMVGGMVGMLVTDLLTTSGDKQMDHDMKAKAEPLKQEARELCTTVRQVRQIQETLVSELPAFKPYAVIDTDSENDCHVDDHSDAAY